MEVSQEFKNRDQSYQKIAKATIRKDKRINIRIAARDLEDIQKKALEEGIPYPNAHLKHPPQICLRPLSLRKFSLPDPIVTI